MACAFHRAELVDSAGQLLHLRGAALRQVAADHLRAVLGRVCGQVRPVQVRLGPRAAVRPADLSLRGPPAGRPARAERQDSAGAEGQHAGGQAADHAVRRPEAGWKQGR